MPRRFLCLWLPRWPLQRLLAARPELAGQTVLLYEQASRGGLKVVQVHSPAVEDHGVYPGMPLAEAVGLLQVKEKGKRGLRIADCGLRNDEGGENKQNAELQNAKCKVQSEILPSIRNPSHSPLTTHSPLHLEPHDPWADRLALSELAHACRRYGPAVGLEDAEQPGSLFMDITGLAEHFGGEEALTEQVLADFSSRGFSVRAALADTIGAAWAIAHYAMKPEKEKGERKKEKVPNAECGVRSDTEPKASALCNLHFAICILQSDSSLHTPHSTLRTSLSPLPVAALRLPEETLSLLSSLGLRRIGQVEALPRHMLLSRFGPELLLRLDQAMGRAPEVLRADRSPPEFVAQREFEVPLDRREAIELVVRELIEELAGRLAQRREGAVEMRIVECGLRIEEVGTRNGERGTEPMRIADCGLRSGKRDNLNSGTEYSVLSTPVLSTEHLDAQRLSLPASHHLVRKPQAASRNSSHATHHSPLTTHLPPLRLSLCLFRPSASPQHLWELVRLQLESIRLREPIAGLRVEVTAAAPLVWEQQELFAGDKTRQAPRHLATLVDRLSSRLGRDAVLRPCLLHDAQPEYACVYLPLAGQGNTHTPGAVRRSGRSSSRSRRVGRVRETHQILPRAEQKSEVTADGTRRVPATLPDERPLRLYRQPLPLEVIAVAPNGPPARFRLLQSTGKPEVYPTTQPIARSWGPERIETGWWRHGLVRRDYYRVETDQGRRFWLFRDLASSQWWLQGEFE